MDQEKHALSFGNQTGEQGEEGNNSEGTDIATGGEECAPERKAPPNKICGDQH